MNTIVNQTINTNKKQSIINNEKLNTLTNKPTNTDKKPKKLNYKINKAKKLGMSKIKTKQILY